MSSEECLIKVTHAALNRRDQWIREGLYPGIQDQVILGSDGCGEVVQGPEKWMGKQVIINPNINWGVDPQVQSANYQILGMPQNGTLAEYMKVPVDRLIEKPIHLPNQEAAAIPLAGLTAFRACFTKAQVKRGHKVLVTGIGGGVSQFVLQFCLAVGVEVYVTSSSDDKIAHAIRAGAEKGFNYKEKDWVKVASKTGGFDAIIDSAGGASVNDYLKLIKPGGKMVFYGSTTGTVPSLNMAKLFWSQVQMIGSTMGNDEEFQQMVQFVSAHELRPIIDQVFDCRHVIEAFDQFKSPDHQGKIVVTFQ